MITALATMKFAVWLLIPCGFSLAFALGAYWQGSIAENKRREQQELAACARTNEEEETENGVPLMHAW